MAASISSENATIATEVYKHKDRTPFCDMCWSFLLDDFVDAKTEEAKVAAAAKARKKKSKKKEIPKKRFTPTTFTHESGSFEPSVSESLLDEKTWEFLEGTESTDGEPMVFKSDKQRREYMEYLEWRKSRPSAKQDDESLQTGSLYSEYTRYTRGDDDESTFASRIRVNNEDGSIATFIDDDPLFACIPDRKVVTKDVSKSKSKSKSKDPRDQEHGRGVERQRSRGHRSDHESIPSLKPIRSPSRERRPTSGVREKSRRGSKSIGEQLRGKIQDRGVRNPDLQDRDVRNPSKVDSGGKWKARIPDVQDRDMRNPDKVASGGKWKTRLWRKDRSVPETKPPRPTKTTSNHPSPGTRKIKASEPKAKRHPTEHVEPRRSLLAKDPAPKHKEIRRKPHKEEPSTGHLESPTKKHTKATKRSTKDSTMEVIEGFLAAGEHPPPLPLTRRVHSYDGVVQSSSLESLGLIKHMAKSPQAPSANGPINQSISEQPTPQESHSYKVQTQKDEEVKQQATESRLQQEQESREEPAEYQPQPQEDLESRQPTPIQDLESRQPTPIPQVLESRPPTPIPQDLESRQATPIPMALLVGGANSAFSPPRGKVDASSVQSVDDQGEDRQDSVAAIAGGYASSVDRDTELETCDLSTEAPQLPESDFQDEIEWTGTSEGNPYEEKGISSPLQSAGSGQISVKPIKKTMSATGSRKSSTPLDSRSHHSTIERGKKHSKRSGGFMLINRVRSGDSSAKSVDRGNYGAFKTKNWGRRTDAESVF